MIGRTNAVIGGGNFTKSVIIVTAPTGSTVTCKSGSTTKTATEKNGTWTFTGIDNGTWTLTATLGGQTTTATVNVTQFDVYRVTLAYVKIYGISRDITASSPAWTRTDDAVGMTATASVGTVAGHSDFSSCYPWSKIARETLSTGDVMVKIPKFWYRRYREGNVENIKIATQPASGFALHPAFNHGGVSKDAVYVGAYKTSNNNKSISGASPQVQQTKTTLRNNAKSKGSGWGLTDISTFSAIQMLILVEYATNNVQAVIGQGYCNGSAPLKVGSCDSVANLTGRPAGTDGTVDVVYRGIEGLWGNIWEWVDGVSWNNGTYYVCNDPTKYADATTTNYTQLSFVGLPAWDNSYITTEGLDSGANNHIMLPSAAGTGSSSTYMCDTTWGESGWRCPAFGGQWVDKLAVGLFRTGFFSDPSGGANGFCGARLQYIPD